MKYFSAQVLLGLCLSGVLADLPYHDFEGRDAHIEVLPQSTTEIPQSQNGQHPPFHHPTGTGSHHHHHHPTNSPTTSEHYSKYALRHEPHHKPNNTSHPTLHPTGGHSDPGHHPHHTHEPPYPTTYPGGIVYHNIDTMKTVTKTRGPSGGFPHGTGSPDPHPHKKGVGEPCDNTSECAPCVVGYPMRVADCGLNTEGKKVCLCLKGKPLTPPGGH
ncbi:hypothetical protein HD806DRAFT_447239 [Xylariaceae sp. AK1471]|nr:hypothetical protein HD806DRAFT_447239 [Xylariaceae sp. AK1471]